jgi:hypothetical protein
MRVIAFKLPKIFERKKRKPLSFVNGVKGKSIEA